MRFTNEDKEMVEFILRHFENDLEELQNDRCGHTEIVSDLKESCREKIAWLESLQKRIEQDDEPNVCSEPYLGYVYKVNRRLVFADSITEAVETFEMKHGNETIENVSLVDRELALARIPNDND